jgi:hypothetical protein
VQLSTCYVILAGSDHRKQMDEEQRKVIDGTARARQWRRSRQQPSAPDGDRPHSEAPKRIAASLLVPSNILDGATPARGVTASHGKQKRPGGDLKGGTGRIAGPKP